MANQDHSQKQPTNIVGWVAVGPQAHPAVLFEPTKSSFNVPPEPFKSTTVFAAPLRDDWFDVPVPEFLPITFVVVAPVPLQSIGARARSANLPGDRRDIIDQGNRFCHIVPVGRCQMDRDRHASSVGEQVDFAAGFAPIDGTRASFRTGAHGTQVTAVDQEAREVYFLEKAQVVEQELMDAWPDARTTPGTEAAPTGHAAAATHFLGEILPRDARFEDEDDAGERPAIVEERSTAFWMRRMRWEKQPRKFPQMVGKQWPRHGTPPCLAAGTDKGVSRLLYELKWSLASYVRGSKELIQLVIDQSNEIIPGKDLELVFTREDSAPILHGCEECKVLPARSWPKSSAHLSSLTIRWSGVEWPPWCSPGTQTAWTAVCPQEFRKILDTKQRKSEQYEIDDSPLWLLIVCDLFNDTQSHIFPTNGRLESFGQIFQSVEFNFADSSFDEVWLFSAWHGGKVRLYPAMHW